MADLHVKLRNKIIHFMTESTAVRFYEWRKRRIFTYEKAFSHIDSAVLYARLHIFITMGEKET